MRAQWVLFGALLVVIGFVLAAAMTIGVTHR